MLSAARARPAWRWVGDLDHEERRHCACRKAAGPGARLGWLFGLIAIGALVAGVLYFGDLERFAALARRARPLWLGAAILLQCGTYGAVALGWALSMRVGMRPHAK